MVSVVESCSVNESSWPHIIHSRSKKSDWTFSKWRRLHWRTKSVQLMHCTSYSQHTVPVPFSLPLSLTELYHKLPGRWTAPPASYCVILAFRHSGVEFHRLQTPTTVKDQGTVFWCLLSSSLFQTGTSYENHPSSNFIIWNSFNINPSYAEYLLI